MIRDKHGVAITDQRSRTEFGVEEVACEVRWLTEPGWLTLEASAPTLCVMTTEIGGRCEFRGKPDQPVDGEYFGSGALAFAAAGSRVAIYAAEMRQARLCCFAFRDTDYLRSEEHTSELQSPDHLVCRLLLEKKKKKQYSNYKRTKEDSTRPFQDNQNQYQNTTTVSHRYHNYSRKTSEDTINTDTQHKT